MLKYIHSVYAIISKIVFLLIIIFVVSTYNNLLCYNLNDFGSKYAKDIKYFIILNTGEIMSGNILKIYLVPTKEQNNILNNLSDTNISKNINTNTIDNETNYILLNSDFGEVIIYEDEIINIKERKNENNYLNPQKHSLFVMPTANPISNNHFVGDYELLFFMAGIGITDWFSIFAGRSILPFTLSNQQISLINAKISFPPIGEPNKSNLTLAAGTNIVWLNSENLIYHIFALATYNSIDMNNSTFTAGIFYKAGNQIFPSGVILFERLFYLDYPDGAFGICGGIERPFANRQDLSLLLEIWNFDVGNASNTAILLGLRKNSRNFHADIGLAFGTHPFAIPFVSFVWMPFNK